ncbi:MAG: 30S ribosomal protein S9 [Bacteroidia bacterium]|nr:30S ribosomal protein S9 [Bacteroidia bacterium]
MNKAIQVGRRKRAVARVTLKAGSGKFTINDREFAEYFPLETTRMIVLEPFTVLDVNPAEYDVVVNVAGGGITGQSEAVRLGITRSLMDQNIETRPPLKKAGLVTRDSRKVERKKPGKRKARKSSQFSKR